MLFWTILVLMTAAALGAVVWPLVVDRQPSSGGSDIMVYKDQLGEIDRDLRTGLIDPKHAEAARVEISRRLLQAADESKHSIPSAGPYARAHRLATLVIAMVFLPAVALGLYLWLGSPHAASIGSTAEQLRSDPNDTDVDAMVSQVEDHLKEMPNDGRGWETLAPIYMRMGRYDDAIRAWQNSIDRLGDSAEREENLGESFIAAANGLVTREARDAFAKARSMDPDSVPARFYAGLAAKQDGHADEAARIWRDLIAAAPPEAEWVNTVRDALARLDEPPTSDGSQSLGDEQVAMIRSMVAGLAARLKIDGGDPDGWLRLIRSYNVLNDRRSAETAAADARQALAGDPNKLARFETGLEDASESLESASRDGAREPASDGASAEHENGTVHAMVDRLAERLERDGGDPDRWFMLVRSYETLGEHDKAAAAAERARLAFASDPEKLSDFERLSSSATEMPNERSANAALPKPGTNDRAVPGANATDQQITMIKGMVGRLAERLKQNGHDADGWAQLIRSYVVLGQRDDAIAAAKSARAALSNDEGGLHRVEAAAAELGIASP